MSPVRITSLALTFLLCLYMSTVLFSSGDFSADRVLLALCSGFVIGVAVELLTERLEQRMQLQRNQLLAKIKQERRDARHNKKEF